MLYFSHTTLTRTGVWRYCAGGSVPPTAADCAVAVGDRRRASPARLPPRQAPDVTSHPDPPAGFIQIDVKYLPPLGAGAATPMSRSTVPPALSTSKSSPIAGSPPA